ncbi:uncharacterized protein LOC135648325 isoform X2 [Musa acuminata AAA Group]|uniref:uncharacterized protein LOC103996910 isoform X2 n=1 Tax=Musa acuminata AAA Group TaxID=214697 RepID=UPI0031E2C42D
MQLAPADRRSTYLAALTQEIERKLQKALISPGQRPELLQKLFADAALEIEDRARDMILKKDEDEIASADDVTETLCFYELFEVSVETSEVLLRYGSALVHGASNVFWIDIQANRRRFFSLFSYLLEEVALVPDRSNKISLQARRDLYLLLSRFLFFYKLDDLLEPFLKHFPAYPNAFLVGGPEDIFVIELSDQLQKLKVEPVLLHYLSRMGALKGLELRMATSTRLKACLYSFTSPGGPMYPTRAVRHAAWDTLDLLFPVGRYPRHVISVFFRLLYPWYWPSSCWNFIVTCVTTVVYYILRVIISSWENIRKSKRS